MGFFKIDEGFWQRLSYYVVGLILGTILVFIIFQNRACNWLPGNRVKDSIVEKIIVFPDDQMERLNENGITKDNIFKFIAHGKVDFGNSIKENGRYPKVYILSNKEIPKIRLQFSLYEDAYITPVHLLEEGEDAVQYKTLEGWGEMVRLPRDSALVYIDESNYTQCKARGLASENTKDIVRALKMSGRINFEKSDLMKSKAIQWITFRQNDTLTVEANTIWFKERITFKDFIWDFKMNCE